MPFRFGVPSLHFKPDELYRVPTADGSAIALGRYHPRGERKFDEAVLLAHSLGTNRFNLDFDERYSFARGLARRGFETWVLELRGHGLAGSSDGATFDTEAEFDVRAALNAVHSATQAKVFWVGHSRGGLLAYAHLARNPEAPIAAIANLASPVSFESQPGVQRLVSALGPALRVPMVPLRLMARSWPLGLPPDPFGKYFLRVENVDPVVIRQVFTHVAADIAGGVARQFARWVRSGKFDGEDGLDYRVAMKAIEVPVLSIAGAADFLSPAVAAHRVAELVSGPVEVVTAGTASGFAVDYGHGDLVLGRTAPDEMVPRIAEFFARFANVRPSP